MKLVSAKCPNCNSNLDVNPKSETTKCPYCNSAILIEDAIEKYKVEISGKVEVANLPKVNNYLKTAQRQYELKEYEEAYKTYKSIIELEPENDLAILRHGICKTMINNYIDFPMNYLLTTMDQTINIIKENGTYDEKVEQYISEIVSTIDSSLYAVRKYYNSYIVNSKDLLEIHIKLLSIYECYEKALEYTNERKEYIINKIISVLKDLIKDKNYKTGTSRSGFVFRKTYKSDLMTKNYLKGRLKYYNELLKDIEASNKQEDGNNTQEESKKMNIISRIITRFKNK